MRGGKVFYSAYANHPGDHPMRAVKKLFTVSLAAAALFAGPMPAQAAATEETPQADQQFCQFTPRLCEALCIGQDTRCRRA